MAVGHHQPVVNVIREATPCNLDWIPILVDKTFVNSVAELKDTEEACYVHLCKHLVRQLHGFHSSGDKRIQIANGDITRPFGQDAWQTIHHYNIYHRYSLLIISPELPYQKE